MRKSAAGPVVILMLSGGEDKTRSNGLSAKGVVYFSEPYIFWKGDNAHQMRESKSHHLWANLYQQMKGLMDRQRML